MLVSGLAGAFATKEVLMVKSKLGLLALLCSMGVWAAAEQELEGLTPEQAQERQRIDALYESSTRRIDGRKDPHLVPCYIRMWEFFNGYARFRKELEPHLTTEDLAILDAFVQHRAEIMRKDEVESNDAWMAIGARAENMSAVEIADALTALTAKTEAKQAARYRAVLDQLTPTGRSAVNDLAYINIRPQVTIHDELAIARADPAFYKMQIVESYKMIKAGTFPPVPPPRATGSAPAPALGRVGTNTAEPVP
jgi:hypothetical protein